MIHVKLLAARIQGSPKVRFETLCQKLGFTVDAYFDEDGDYVIDMLEGSSRANLICMNHPDDYDIAVECFLRYLQKETKFMTKDDKRIYLGAYLKIYGHSSEELSEEDVVGDHDVYFALGAIDQAAWDEFENM